MSYMHIFSLKYVHIMELYMQKTAHILSFRLLRLPFDFGTLHHNRRADPIFFGDALDVAVVDVHKAAAV